MKLMKKGRVLEGGAMRGLFTCGVIDVFLENDIRFDEGLSLGEDVCWLASCLPLAHEVASVADSVYE